MLYAVAGQVWSQFLVLVQVLNFIQTELSEEGLLSGLLLRTFLVSGDIQVAIFR